MSFVPAPIIKGLIAECMWLRLCVYEATTRTTGQGQPWRLPCPPLQFPPSFSKMREGSPPSGQGKKTRGLRIVRPSQENLRVSLQPWTERSLSFWPQTLVR